MQHVYQWVLPDSVVKLTIYVFSSIKTRKLINNMTFTYAYHMILKSTLQWPSKHTIIVWCTGEYLKITSFEGILHDDFK